MKEYLVTVVVYDGFIFPSTHQRIVEAENAKKAIKYTREVLCSDLFSSYRITDIKKI